MKRPIPFIVVMLMIVLCSCSTSSENVSADNAYHKDEIAVLSHEVNSGLSDGFYVVKYKISNNTDDSVEFHYISIIEIDVNGDILRAYNSWNKASRIATLTPNQSMYIELTFKKSDNIAEIRSDKYEIMLSDGQVINGVITTPYIVTVPYTKNPDSTAMGQTEIPEQKSISTKKKYSSLLDFWENSKAKDRMILETYDGIYDTTTYPEGNTLVSEHRYKKTLDKDSVSLIKKENEKFFKEHEAEYEKLADIYETYIDADIKIKELYLNHDGSFLAEYIFS